MEPSKKFQPNIEPDIRPDLHVVQGGGESTPERGNLEAAKQLNTTETDTGNRFGVINGGGESTPERGNLQAVTKDAETSNNGYWAGKGSDSNKPKSTRRKITGTLTGRKAATGGLIGLIIGVPTIISILLTPGLVLQQFVDAIRGEFNDQVAALDVRSTLLLKKKLHKDVIGGVCTKKVTIRCKYQSIRKNSGLAKRLKRAGIEIVEDKKSVIPGRLKPSAFKFEGKVIAANDLLKEARVNKGLRDALRKGYDPIFAATSDRLAARVRSTVTGLKRTTQVEPGDKEKMNEQLKAVTAGTEAEQLNGKRLQAYDKEGNPVGDNDPNAYSFGDETDKNKYTVEEGRRLNTLFDELIGRNELGDLVKKTMIKAGVKSALTVTALGAGAVDTACTAWNTVRLASFAAKVYQQRQLVRYAYEFKKISDKQRYGDLTAEEMEFYGNKLTQINSQGKGALDSDGYKFAAYGDIFRPGDFKVVDEYANSSAKDDALQEATAEKVMIQNETSRYVNGQLLNDNLMSKLASAVTGGKSSAISVADDTCGFVKSWKGQAILIGVAVLGAAVAILTGGGSLGWGVAVGAAASAAISVAFALIQPKLIDMVKGEVIKGDENGNETGNAVASGAGGQNAQDAQHRGLGVATQDVYAAYRQLTTQTIAKQSEIERSSLSPFDASSSSTFLGSFMRTITPYISKMSSPGNTGFAAASFISSAFSSLGANQVVQAATEKAKYSQCEDYELKGIAADPFCNPRYAIPPEDLKIDAEDVTDFMLSSYTLVFDESGNPVIDPETGEQKKIYNWIESPSDPTPKGEYAEFIKNCIDRKNPLGDNVTPPSESDGNECVIGRAGGNENKYKNFRLFYIDQSVSDGMDEDFPEEPGTSGSSANKSGSGSGDSASFSGDVAWPLEKKWWNASHSNFLKPHTGRSDSGLTGTAWGEDNMGTSDKGAGIAADIGIGTGEPVFAMVGGKVTSTNLCGEGDGIAVKTDVNGTTLGIAYMHGTNQQFKVGDTVEAGDHIIDTGMAGCNVYGAHLHVGIAYGGKYICPQDVFLALDKGEDVNWGVLTGKANVTCPGRDR